MVDVLSPAQRHLNMSRIRGKDTKPEMLLRRGLHKLGFRYRLHVRNLPGCPDLVFPSLRAAVFVNGCFWHGHSCPMFKLPETRTDFWAKKINANRERDKRALDALHASGWRAFVLWECSVRGHNKGNLNNVIEEVASWLRQC